MELNAHLFIVSKSKVKEHVLFQESPDGTLIDVSRLITEQLRVIHVLRRENRINVMEPADI